MTQYRVGEQGATVVNSDGDPVVLLRPGYCVEGDLVAVPADAPKRRKGYQDKAIRAERDYEDKSLT